MAKKSLDSFGVRTTLSSTGQTYHYFDLTKLEAKFPGKVTRLPFSIKILLENLLRQEDGEAVLASDIESVLNWDPKKQPDREIAFMPARVLMQDFTGVPAIVDLAAMRDAMTAMDNDPKKINPLLPAELVIDHSVQVDHFGTKNSFHENVEIEFARNQERYGFLRWGQIAFDNFKVVPPGTGIVHQVNLEYLGRVVFEANIAGERYAYPDTLVGTDSHTTMINGLGVLGWGVGGIEAEAAMLGQPITMLIPQVIGFKLFGSLPEGTTATDLVLTVTEMLRKKGVVGKFVEFYGEGISCLSLADRATIANMAPEYGATCGIFPIDAETLNYLRFSGRSAEQAALVEVYAKAQGMWHAPHGGDPAFTDTLELNLAHVEPSLAGPKRPQDRVALGKTRHSFNTALPELRKKSKTGEVQSDTPVQVTYNGETFTLQSGAVVIAAITSCTNTSNPSVMVGAGLLAKKAIEKGLVRKPWVKTSLAPGSQVVTEYLNEAGLTPYLNQLGFNLVGYGCTTCIGNSGPLPEQISKAIEENNLVVSSVLSGNRNFEGRVHPEVRANYLASPPLVVAFALAGRIDIDLQSEPIGQDQSGKPVFLKDIWPSQKEITDTVRSAVKTEMFLKKYGEVFKGDVAWQKLNVPKGDLYQWDERSTYVRKPPYFKNMPKNPKPLTDIAAARVLAMLGDSVTTDHISPAGSIRKDSPAGKYLMEHGIKPEDFNSYGARRGNHEVMMRGTFANVRLRNELAPNTEGGVTRHLPDGTSMSIYEASMLYQSAGVPLVVIAGKEYGAGSSRDWAAKGAYMLGIRAVIAESYERIHRSNLIGMGVLPLQFKAGDGRKALGLTGEEVFDIQGITNIHPGKHLAVIATAADGTQKTFEVTARIDTPVELKYFQHGGILHFVLRSLR